MQIKLDIEHFNFMKILFICGSAEPGKDGVGDYTRRLCGELFRKGHEAHILTLCDHKAISFTVENQKDEEVEVIVHRIPLSTSNNLRSIWSQDILNNFQPDWISLQFVPYSFNSKGLPFWLPSFLNKLKGNHKWHLMFHELWIGMDSNASFRYKCIGLFQRKIVSRFLKKIDIKVINTQSDLYKFKIAELGYNVQIVPLFSNIIKNEELNVKRITDNLELKFCFFGSIHHGAPVVKFFDELLEVLSILKEKRVLKFIFIGNCGAAIEEWKNKLSENNIEFEITGFVTDKEISNLLSGCQYGISTTPYILSQKSGSLVAMFDHQLPVLCVARDWEVKGFNQRRFLNLVNYENEATISDFMSKKFVESDENNIEFVALNFLNGLK
jgi:hypothetical protein